MFFIKLYGSYTHRTGQFFSPFCHNRSKNRNVENWYVKCTSTWSSLQGHRSIFFRTIEQNRSSFYRWSDISNVVYEKADRGNVEIFHGALAKYKRKRKGRYSYIIIERRCPGSVRGVHLENKNREIVLLYKLISMKKWRITKTCFVSRKLTNRLMTMIGFFFFFFNIDFFIFLFYYYFFFCVSFFLSSFWYPLFLFLSRSAIPVQTFHGLSRRYFTLTLYFITLSRSFSQKILGIIS